MKHIELKRLTMLFFFGLIWTPFIFAQGQIKVSGKVIDQNNQPMIGVTVAEKGTTNGTVTDIDGNYRITAAQGTTLLFSFVGFTSQEVVVSSANPINVTLAEDSKTIEELVVVGYGVQKKSSVTGAISQVKTEDIQNRTISNAQQALQGKTAGVQVIQTSAAPGASPTIRIRGYSSNAASDPLYVVDGVRLSDISGIDPSDIASMEVLKDAASAAIYGAEAGNGVVLITTKRGKKGEGKINYDFQYTIQNLSKIPKMLNSEQYIDYMTEAGYFTKEYLLKNWDGVTNTSWADVAFENSIMQKHNLSLTNGTDKGTYYLALSYLNNDGIVKGNADVYNRLTVTINAEQNIKSWLKIGTTNQIEKYKVRTVSSNNEYGSLLTSVLQLDPLTPDTYTYSELPLNMLTALNTGKHLLTNSSGSYYSISKFLASEQYHPMIMRDKSKSSNRGYNVTGSVFADLKPLKDLTITSRLGYRLSTTNSSVTDLPFYGNAVQSNDYLGLNATSSNTFYYQWENFANYMKRFGQHTATAMLGMSYQESVYEYVKGTLTANGEDAILKNDPLFYYLNYASSSSVKGVNGEKTTTAKLSYFGRLGYDYAGKYMVQGSLRADAADLSYLPKNNRWGYFPAVSVGWTVSEENFFEPLKAVVNSLKVRGSWGQNGSLSALGGYSYSTDMTTGGFYPFTSGIAYILGASPSNMGNDELKWETSEQTNVGVDGRMFNDRLTFSVDYFEKKTKDLLVWGTTPSLIVGGTSSPMNAGNVENKGVEFELGWKERIGDFTYSVRGDLATLKNRVTYLDPSLTRIEGTRFHTSGITYFEQGYPVYYFRGYKFTGVDPNTGDPTFADLDGSGTITDEDKTCIGDAIPDFTYGITITAAWKGIDFTLFGTGAHGNDIFNCITRPDYGTSNKLKEIFYDNRWTETNKNGTVPRAGANNFEKYLVSDALVYSGSYFKIKQIQVGYTLPQQLLKKAFISNLRVYASLDDYFTITKYPGFDPEAAASTTSGMGVDKGSYPCSKKVVFGLNIEF